MALTLPKLVLTRKQVLTIVGGVVIVSAAGWFGWQYFEDTPPAPGAKTQPVAAAKQAGPAKAAAPTSPSPAQKAAAAPTAADKPQAEAQTAVAKPASETVAVAEAPSKPAPDVKRDTVAAAAPAQQKRPLPARNQDLRKCLDLESNAAIIKCAER